MKIPGVNREKLPWQFRKGEVSEESAATRFWDCLFLSLSMSAVVVVGVTFFLFVYDIPITRIHGVFYCFTLMLVTWLFSGRTEQSWLTIGGLQFLVHALSLIFVSQFYDLGGDGMASHQDSILALESEWVPITDPYYMRAETLAQTYPEAEHMFWSGRGALRSFSYTLSAIFAKTIGVHESGKAVHLLCMWMAFTGAMSFSTRIFRNRSNQWLFALVAGLNPVICYQFLSYWQDGMLAGIYTALIFSGMIWVLNPKKKGFLVAFIGLSFLLSGLKLAGVGYAGITAAIIYGAAVYRGGNNFGMLFVVGCLNLFLIGLAGVMLGAWTFHKKIVDPIAEKIEHFDSEEVNAGGESYTQVEDFYQMNRFLVFAASMASSTAPVARSIELKPPFSTSWEELKTFYFFFEDPRAGGMGVFYSGLLLLSAFLFVSGIRKNWQMGIWAALAVGILIAPLFFVPTYWARWIPQTWLIPLFLSLPFWVNKESECNKSSKVFSFGNFLSLPWHYVFACIAILNAGLIFVPYVVGNSFGTRLIREQLQIVKSLPEPVAYGNVNYPTNRKWLIDAGIDYDMTWDPDEWKKDYLQFYRSDTRIFISDADFDRKTSEGLTVRESLEALKIKVSKWQEGQWLSEVFVEQTDAIE